MGLLDGGVDMSFFYKPVKHRFLHWIYHLMRGRKHKVTINYGGRYECIECGWEHNWDFPEKGW